MSTSAAGWLIGCLLVNFALGKAAPGGIASRDQWFADASGSRSSVLALAAMRPVRGARGDRTKSLLAGGEACGTEAKKFLIFGGHRWLIL
jgi:hypothetical protein